MGSKCRPYTFSALIIHSRIAETSILEHMHRIHPAPRSSRQFHQQYYYSCPLFSMSNSNCFRIRIILMNGCKCVERKQSFLDATSRLQFQTDDDEKKVASGESARPKLLPRSGIILHTAFFSTCKV